MQRTWHNMMWVVMMAMMLAGCNGTAKKTEPSVTVRGAHGTEPVEILRQTAGSDEAFARIGDYLLNAAGDSAANLETLAPNYQTETVIVVALGEVPTGGYGVNITGVQKKGDQLFVQFTVSQPAADAVTTQALTYPYAAVAVPKTTGRVTLEDVTK